MVEIKRVDLRDLSVAKLAAARALLAAGHWANAYYLAGYSIECALKASVSKAFRADTLPDKAFVQKLYVHDLSALVGFGGLSQIFEEARNADDTLNTNWAVVKDWNEGSRYLSKTEDEANALLNAIDDEAHGVLTWIKQHW